MSSPMFKRFALLGALAALMVGLGASAAFASVVLPKEGPFEATDSVKVKGVADGAQTGATHVAIVVCNVATGVTPGSRCDKGSASGGAEEKLEPIAKYEAGITINIQQGPWQDYSYLMGTPPSEVTGSTTTCLNEAEEGDQCAVVVSFYDLSKGFKQLGPQKANIFFE